MERKVIIKENVEVIPMVPRPQPRPNQIVSLETYRQQINSQRNNTASRPFVPNHLISSQSKGIYQCRLCLAIQKQGNTFTPIHLPHVWKPLKDIFGITVGEDEIWNRSSKICQICLYQLQQSYKFFCKVKTTERYLKTLIVNKKREREDDINNTNSQINKRPIRLTNATENIHMKKSTDRLEDHTKFEPVPCPSAEPEIPVEMVIDLDPNTIEDNEEDTDLDFDFTDDEKDEDDDNDKDKKKKESDVVEIKDEEVEEIKDEEVEEIKDEEVKTKKIKIENTPECKKVANLILDSGVNGIESQINCCLIDKKTLQQGTQPEEIMLVVDDKKESVGTKSAVNPTPPLPITRLNPPIKRNALRETEYIVCDRCKIIYHRPLGSETRKCETCTERDNTS